MQIDNQFSFENIIKKNIKIIRTIFVIVNVFILLSAVKTYISYQNLVEEIRLANIQTKKISDEYDFFNNFYNYYLNSDYSSYFKAHENEILFDNEYIVNIKKRQLTWNIENQKSKRNMSEDFFLSKKPQTPSEKRNVFLKERFLHLFR